MAWFKDKNLIALSVTFMLANIGWGMAWPYLPVYIEIIGGSLLAVGLLSILYNIFASVFQYPWGKMSDKYHNRKIFISTGVLGSGFLYYVIALSVSPLIVLGYRSIQGMVTSMSTPASSALIVEMAGTHTGIYFGIFNSFSELGYTVGSLLGSAAVVYFHSIKAVFVIAFLLLLLSALVGIIFIKEKKLPIDRAKIPFPVFRHEGKPGRMPLNIKDAINMWETNRKIIIIFFAVLFVMSGSGEVYSLLPIYFDKFGQQWVGFLYGIEAISITVTMPLMGYIVDKLGKRITLLIGIVGYIITFILFSIMPSPQLMIVAEVVSGIKWSAFLIGSSTYIASISPKDKMARGQALLNTAQTGGWVIGPIAAIIAATYLNLILNFYIAIIFVGIGLIIALLYVKEPLTEK